MWTAEQDEQLLKLKGEGKAWNEIASILGKFKKQATSRYGELMKAESKQKEPAKKEVSKKEVPKKEEVVVVTVEEDKPDVADPSGFNMDALQSGVDPNVDPKHPYVIKQQKKAGNGKGKKAKEPIITPWADGNLSMSEVSASSSSSIPRLIQELGFSPYSLLDFTTSTRRRSGSKFRQDSSTTLGAGSSHSCFVRGWKRLDLCEQVSRDRSKPFLKHVEDSLANSQDSRAIISWVCRSMLQLPTVPFHPNSE